MSDILLLNEEIKSDKYEVSINKLLLFNQPNSIVTLSNLLEERGYYGRFKIHKIHPKNRGDNNFKIEVYLPNSTFTYFWPQNSIYSLNTNNIIKNKNMVFYGSYTFVTPLIFLKNLKYKIEQIEYTSLEMFQAYATRGYGFNKEFIYRMMQMKYIVNGKVIFKTDDDIVEIFENLYDNQYKVLLSR